MSDIVGVWASHRQIVESTRRPRITRDQTVRDAALHYALDHRCPEEFVHTSFALRSKMSNASFNFLPFPKQADLVGIVQINDARSRRLTAKGTTQAV
jgi:hypothetical protein